MRRITFAVIAVALLAWTGIAQSERTIVDQAGYEVSLPDSIESIASVYGIGTYFVYSLGAGDRLTTAYYIGLKSAAQATATMQRWEPRLSDLLSFGDPNVEELVAGGADVVLADASQHEAVAAQLRELGIPVVLLSAEHPDAMKEAIQLLATALGEEAQRRADAFVDAYDRVISCVAADVSPIADTAPVRVLFLGTSASTAIGGEMYQTNLIEAAGGVSVTEGLSGGWNEVNLEQILRWDPDVILIAPYGPVQPSDLLEHADWQSLQAVQAGRVVRMPRLIAPMDTPVPESMLGVLWMATLFYPEVVTLDLADEVVAFYATYYGVTLTDEEIAAFAFQ